MHARRRGIEDGHSFAVTSVNGLIDVKLPRILRRVRSVHFEFVQLPAVNAPLPTAVCVVETDPSGLLTANDSTFIGGIEHNPGRSFVVLPQPSLTATSLYTVGQYHMTAGYPTPIDLTNIRLGFTDLDGEPITFAGGEEAVIYITVVTDE